MKKIFIVSVLCFLLQACSSKQAEVVYTRPDVKTNASAVIVLPTTTPNAEVNNSTQLISNAIYADWAKIYGKKAIPAGPALEQLLKQKNFKKAYIKLIETFDSVSGIEQVLKNANIQKFLRAITDNLGATGDVRFAFSILHGDEESYNKGESLYLNVGLFDVSGATWKVITKTESKKGQLTNFKVDFGGIVKQHFNSIKQNIEVVEEK